jgi:glucokinase
MEASLVTVDTVKALPRCGAVGADIGATKTQIRFREPAGGTVEEFTVPTDGHESLDRLLLGCFSCAGFLPQHVTVAAAGRPDGSGNVQITNHKEWPVFRPRVFERTLPVDVSVVNDMYASAVGADCLRADEIRLLTLGVVAPGTSAKLVVSVGSGVGSAFLDASGCPHTSETGHLPWQPVTALEASYLACQQETRPGTTVSVEQAIGGMAGFDRLYRFVRDRELPAPHIELAVEQLRMEVRGIGPALTNGARAGDRCCRLVLELFGGIFGQYLRTLALSTLAGTAGGTVYLTSGVLQAPGVADYLIRQTSAMARFVDHNAEHADLLAGIPLYLVVDRSIAVRGAFTLAERALIPKPAG